MKETRKKIMEKVLLGVAIGIMIFTLGAVGWNQHQLKKFEAEFGNPDTTYLAAPVSYGVPTAGVTAQMQKALVQSKDRELTMKAVVTETDKVQAAPVDYDPEVVAEEMRKAEEETVEMNTPKPQPITFESAHFDYTCNPDVITDKHMEVLASSGMNQKMYIGEWLVNVRQKPGTEFDVVTTVPAGTEVNVECLAFDTDGNKWAQIGDGQFIRMDLLSETSPLIYMGNYLITYYCACAKCCDVETGITASGAHVQEGVTCAADPSIPFGTKLKIGDHVYTVQDRGGAIKGNHVDIYIDGHQRALQQDMGYKDVYMVVE